MRARMQRCPRAAASPPAPANPLERAGAAAGKPPTEHYPRLISKRRDYWQVPHGETPDAIRNHPLLKRMNLPRTGQDRRGGDRGNQDSVARRRSAGDYYI